MDLELSGQSIIVTGGSSGIGLETARLLVAEGARVTICGRDPDRLTAAEADLDTADLHVVSADVRDAAEAAGVVTAALLHGTRLDGIAAVAGRGRHGGLLDLDPSVVMAEVSDKLLGFLNVVRPAVSALTGTAGRIVGLTAPSAARPDPRRGAIGVGRAALANALEALAVELASSGIRVNAVGLGLIDTPRQQARHGESGCADTYVEWLTEQARLRSVPLGRAGTPTEVAAAICWLLSPISSYTTGAVLDVTGGHRSR